MKKDDDGDNDFHLGYVCFGGCVVWMPAYGKQVALKICWSCLSSSQDQLKTFSGAVLLSENNQEREREGERNVIMFLQEHYLFGYFIRFNMIPLSVGYFLSNPSCAI